MSAYMTELPANSWTQMVNFGEKSAVKISKWFKIRVLQLNNKWIKDIFVREWRHFKLLWNTKMSALSPHLFLLLLWLYQLLYDHTDPIPGEEKWPVIGQFSSIGSMGLDKTKWLAGEFQRTMTTLGRSSHRSNPPMHLVRSSDTHLLWSVACVLRHSNAVRKMIQNNTIQMRFPLTAAAAVLIMFSNREQHLHQLSSGK